MAVLSIQAGALWNRAASPPPGRGFALLVSVVDSYGRPVAGLAESDFAIAVFDKYPQAPPSALPTTVSDFGETGSPSGVYGMGISGLNQYSDAEAVVVIDVASGSDTGRGLLNIVW